jgi:hypothetical protein
MRRDRLRPVHNGSAFLTVVDDTEVVPPMRLGFGKSQTCAIRIDINIHRSRERRFPNRRISTLFPIVTVRLQR